MLNSRANRKISSFIQNLNKELAMDILPCTWKEDRLLECNRLAEKVACWFERQEQHRYERKNASIHSIFIRVILEASKIYLKVLTKHYLDEKD